MVLSANQTTAFWETELALPGATRQRLVLEGLADIADLTEIDTENLKQIADNLRRPAGSGRCKWCEDDPNSPLCVWCQEPATDESSYQTPPFL